jgi:hypothetical protein
METESLPETLKKFYTLAQLSARDDFIEFCRRENFQDIYKLVTDC